MMQPAEENGAQILRKLAGTSREAKLLQSRSESARGHFEGTNQVRIDMQVGYVAEFESRGGIIAARREIRTIQDMHTNYYSAHSIARISIHTMGHGGSGLNSTVSWCQGGKNNIKVIR